MSPRPNYKQRPMIYTCCSRIEQDTTWEASAKEHGKSQTDWCRICQTHSAVWIQKRQVLKSDYFDRAHAFWWPDEIQCHSWCWWQQLVGPLPEALVRKQCCHKGMFCIDWVISGDILLLLKLSMILLHVTKYQYIVFYRIIEYYWLWWPSALQIAR